MNNNIDFTENVSSFTPIQKNDVNFVDIPINDQNMALNIMVSFLGLAQKRGAFAIDESAKIWECIKMFRK
jgi:predicted transport protein